MPMKVTVCFDDVRVIVPCGNGTLSVQELSDKAITRYRKATGKPPDHWVTVHNIKTVSGGGILDPDDQLSDVVDDREQLIADFEEQASLHHYPHNGGDGASASSAGTASPDIFYGGESNTLPIIHVKQTSLPYDSKNDVIITNTDLSPGSGLTVRRGSEPALNLIGQTSFVDHPVKHNNIKQKKPVIEESDESNTEETDTDTLPRRRSGQRGSGRESPFNRFSRDSSRQSLGNRPEMFKWLEAQEKQEDKYKQSNQNDYERKEPLGGPIEYQLDETSSGSNESGSDSSIVLYLKNDGKPLGIHVIPDYDDDGREMGLLIQRIEKGGKINRDGRLGVEDRIIEINRISLVNVSFNRAQDIFRSAMHDKDIYIRVVKKETCALYKQPQPPLPKPRNHAPIKPSPLTLPPPKLISNSSSPPSTPDKTSTPSEPSPDFPNDTSTPSSPNENSPSRKKVPPAVPTRHPSTTLTSKKDKFLKAPTNTKRIGKVFDIQLVKGELSLGFSITTRDNPAGDLNPIYVKNILKTGPAITDGRLKPGDRLLEVNGVDMTQKTHFDAVGVLRNIPKGTVVNIVVSRQELVDERFVVPRELNNTKPDVDDVDKFQPYEKAEDDGTLADLSNKEIMLFDIPLNDSGSAGLGVSVKGKTMATRDGPKDLGIFIKAVISGGAASRDGRLILNDQLLEVNSKKLTGIPNTHAMALLRKAMHTEGPKPGYICITIARPVGSVPVTPLSDSSDGPNLSMVESVEMELEELQKNVNDLNNSQEEQRDGSKTPVNLVGNGLRNESYHMATNDSLNLSSSGADRTNLTLVSLANKPSVSNAPTLNSGTMETVMIEEDMYAQVKKPQKLRPHSTLGVFRNSVYSSSSDDAGTPFWLNDLQQEQRLSVNESDLSPEAQVEDPFNREGFGRRSMSEKRKGHVDPRATEFYQKVKNYREIKGTAKEAPSSSGSRQKPVRLLVRSNSAESLSTRTNTDSMFDNNDIFPFLNNQHLMVPGQRRSFSLESVTSPEISADDDEHQYGQSGRVSRGRMCNESFRAAVDRSYDPLQETMDPLEEESSESGSLSQGRSNSARSSFSSENADVQNQRRMKKKAPRKSGNIFKGLFRIGKNRRSDEGLKSTTLPSHQPSTVENHISETYTDHNRLPGPKNQSYYPYPAQSQSSSNTTLYSQSSANNRSATSYARERQIPHDSGYNSLPKPPHFSQYTSSKSKLEQLRKEHQRRHMERHGLYPNEEKDELYERQIEDNEYQKYNPSGVEALRNVGVSLQNARNHTERRESDTSGSSVFYPNSINNQDSLHKQNNHQDHLNAQNYANKLHDSMSANQHSTKYQNNDSRLVNLYKPDYQSSESRPFKQYNSDYQSSESRPPKQYNQDYQSIDSRQVNRYYNADYSSSDSKPDVSYNQMEYQNRSQGNFRAGSEPPYDKIYHPRLHSAEYVSAYRPHTLSRGGNYSSERSYRSNVGMQPTSYKQYRSETPPVGDQSNFVNSQHAYHDPLYAVVAERRHMNSVTNMGSSKV